jgi:hypothetical protein
MNTPSHAASATDRWVTKFNEYHRNIEAIAKINLSQLPYALLKSIQTTIQDNWLAWQNEANRLSGRSISNAAEFMTHLASLGNSMTLTPLTKISQRVDAFAISQCLMKCNSFENSRQQANQDLNKGFVEDIDPETLNDLAIEIVKNSIDWRLLSDGLGFNYYDCQSFKDPKEIIKRWVSEDPQASVCRLYFEAEHIGMHSICAFLNAIPLDGIAKVTPPRDSALNMVRKVTRFDLVRLEELCKAKHLSIDWGKIARQIIRDVLENHPLIPAFELLWISHSCQLNNLFYALESDYQPILNQFKKDMRLGLFEPTNRGGLGLSQISYLGSLKFSPPTLGGFFQQWGPVRMNMLKPWRSYDLNLAKAQAEKHNSTSSHQTQEVAKEVQSVASPILEKEDNSCGICMDHQVDAVILPCAHLGYCLDCLKNLQHCPACNAIITKRVKIYNLNK